MGLLLDVRTLSFATGLTALVMFLCMLHITMQRRTYPGFNYWTWAALANGVGFVLLSFRHLLPDEGTVIAANWLIGLSAVLICRGLARFSQKPQFNWLDSCALILSAAIFVHFTIWQPSVTARIAFISFFLAIFYMRAALLTIGPVTRLLGQQNVLLIWALFIMSAWLLVRGVASGIWAERVYHTIAATSWQGVSFFAFMVCNILIMVGLISINGKRLENDLASADEEIKSLQGIIPVCASCNRVRDDQGFWQNVETYLKDHTGAELSHGICPECLEKLYPELNGGKK